MTNPEVHGLESGEPVDPDPFTIGLAIFGAVAGGGAFLEARRQRQFVEGTHRSAFRAKWYEAKRTVVHFKQNIDEFETYVLEESLGRKNFGIGSVRLTLDQGRTRGLRRLRGQAFVTAQRMGDVIDELSEYLGSEDHDEISRVLDRLSEVKIPETYSSVIATGRQALELYVSFLDTIDDRERFTMEQ